MCTQKYLTQKRFPPPRVKWEGKCAEYCSAWAMCLKRGNEEEKGPLCVPIPSPSTYPVQQKGKKRERIQMEPKRMNSVGSTSGQYYGWYSFRGTGMFPKANIFDELLNGTRLGVVMIEQYTSSPHLLLTHSLALFRVFLPDIELLSPRRPRMFLRKCCVYLNVLL